MDMLNHLLAETVILNQLKGNISTVNVNKILTAADMQGVTEQSQFFPSIQVFFYDETPIAQNNGGNSGPRQLVEQTWLVIIVNKNVKDKTGSLARNDAGVIISETISLLHNYNPGHPFTKFERVKSPFRATYRNGFFYFPMAFKTKFSTTGNNNGRV